MKAKSLSQLVKFCRQKWLQLLIVLLILAVLISISVMENTRHPLMHKDNSNVKKKDPSNHDSSSSSQQRLSGSQGDLTGELQRPDQFVADELEKKKGREERRQGFSRESISLFSPREERGVRQVRDIPLLLLNHKLRDPPGGDCPHNFSGLEEEAARRVRNRKSFTYMRRLYQAMAVETESADIAEDAASATWAIRAYAPVQRTQHTVLFRRAPGSECNVTRLEFLIGLRDRDRDGSERRRSISVVVNGQTLKPSPGTFPIGKAVVFDLTAETSTSSSSSSHDHSLNISISRGCCSAAQVCHSMLFEYCNINDTVRNRFRVGIAHNDKPTDASDHTSHAGRGTSSARPALHHHQLHHHRLHCFKTSCINSNDSEAAGRNTSSGGTTKSDRDISITNRSNIKTDGSKGKEISDVGNKGHPNNTGGISVFGKSNNTDGSISRVDNYNKEIGSDNNLKKGSDSDISSTRNHRIGFHKISYNNNNGTNTSITVLSNIGSSDNTIRRINKRVQTINGYSESDINRFRRLKEMADAMALRDPVLGPRIKAGKPPVTLHKLPVLPLFLINSTSVSPSVLSSQVAATLPTSTSSRISSLLLSAAAVSSSSSSPSESSSPPSSLLSALPSSLPSPLESSASLSPSLPSSLSPSLASSSSSSLSSATSLTVKNKPVSGLQGRFRIRRSPSRQTHRQIAQRSDRSPKRTCERGEMQVDLFHDLHLPVLIPTRPVDVGQCRGTCIHASHMGQAGERLTAHAVLLNKLAGTPGAAARWGPAMRMSSCVPHRMKTMSILLSRFDQYSTFGSEIVNWPNMVIASCRCA